MLDDIQKKSTQKHSTLVGCLLILAFAVYANSLFGGFVMDDHMQIEQNPQLQSVRALPEIFTTKAWSFHATQYVPTFYRPIPIAGFLLCHKLFGSNAVGYHLVNVLLHLVVVWLVFAVGLQLGKDAYAALFAALIFAWHPVHTEAVSWIAGVMDVELSIFFLLAFLFFLKLEVADGENVLWLQLGMYLSFLCALLSKEQAVTFPVLATCYEYGFRRDRLQTDWRKKVLRYGGLWIVFLAYFLFRSSVLGGVIGKRFHPDVTLQEAVLTGTALLGKYVGKVFWPIPLSYYYPFEKYSSIGQQAVIIGILVCVLSGVIVFTLRRVAWLYAFSILFFFLTLSPVLNARWMPGTIFAERYLYLPSVGICWMVSSGAMLVWKKLTPQSPSLRWVFVPAGVCVLLFSAHLTWARNRDWQNDRALVLKTLDVWPHSSYHRVNLARMLWDEGEHAQAEGQLQIALTDDPQNPVALWDMGKDLLAEGKYALALDYVNQSLAVRSEFAPPYFYRGRIYEETGHFEAAEADFLHAIEISPNSTEFRNALGKLYLAQKRTADAERQFEISVNSVPNLEGYRNLAEIYTQRGATVQAEIMWKNVLQIEPFAARARFQLGKIYLKSGRREEAKKEYQQGLMMDPHNTEAQAALLQIDKQEQPMRKN